MHDIAFVLFFSWLCVVLYISADILRLCFVQSLIHASICCAAVFPDLWWVERLTCLLFLDYN